MDILSTLFTPEFMYSIIRVSTPLVLASLGAVITSRAGVTNIGIEGIMLISSLSAVLASAYLHNIWLGLLVAVIVGVIASISIAYFHLNLKTDLTLTCIAFNAMMTGGTVFLMYSLTKDKGNTISLDSGMLPNLRIPIINDIPVIGQIFSNHNVLSYVAMISIIVVSILLNKTPLGMRIKAAGEFPEALESVGKSVVDIRYKALMLSGIFGGLAGAFMSMSYVSWFSRNNAAGRGFIALAANAMGNSTPIGATVSSLLFGFTEALSYPLQTTQISSELVQMLPYVATVIGLILYSNKEKRKHKMNVKKGEK